MANLITLKRAREMVGSEPIPDTDHYFSEELAKYPRLFENFTK
jgi:hypothetical protein